MKRPATLWPIGGLLFLALGCACSGPPASPPAVEVSPETAALLQQLETLRQEERHTEGIALAREHLSAQPDDAPIRYGLGVLLGASDDHRAAIREFEAALLADPEHFGSHQGLAIAWTRLGELEASLPYLEKCLSLRPGDADLTFQLGRNLSAVGVGLFRHHHRHLAPHGGHEVLPSNGNVSRDVLVDSAHWATALGKFRRAVIIVGLPDRGAQHVVGYVDLAGDLGCREERYPIRFQVDAP